MRSRVATAEQLQPSGMVDWLGGAKALTAKPRKKSVASPAQFEAAIVEASELIESGDDWQRASPSILVGLYALLHQRVYGVAAVDVADAWRYALSAAVRLLEAEPFNGDATKAMTFIRWCWQQEKQREERSQGRSQSRRRLTWRLQFVERHLLVDWLRTVAQRQRSK